MSVFLPTPKGCAHPNARFTPTELEELRRRLEHRTETLRAIAQDYGCSPTTILSALRGTTYQE